MIELIVATGLSALLMILIGTTWRAFGRPSLEVEARARIEQEAILAAQSLACDFGGFLPDIANRSGTMQIGSASPYQASSPFWDASHPGVLLLNFYGATTSDTIVISYSLVAIPGSTSTYTLVRTSSSTNVSTTIARYVTAFAASAVPGNPDQLSITLTISYRNFTSTFNFIGVSPS